MKKLLGKSAILILFFLITISTSTFNINYVLSYEGESVPQAMGPAAIAITNDGKYAYISFDIPQAIFKVRLEDLTVEAVAYLSEYFPIDYAEIALDSSEEKLFVCAKVRQKLLVLNTQTMSVIHIIENINITGIIQSQYGHIIITWDGGGMVKFVNTETYEVTESEYDGMFFIKIQEDKYNQNLWYVVSGKGAWPSGAVAGIYDHKAKVWKDSISIPLQENDYPSDFKVLPNEQKAYVATFGGWYPDYHAYGWLYSIDLVGGEVKVISIDGGAACLEASIDSKWLYVATSFPVPDTNNLLVIDTHSDTIIGTIDLGRSKYGWSYTDTRDMLIDYANPNFLYISNGDGNAFIKVNLNSLTLLDVRIFNKEDLNPNYFARRPMHSSGFILTFKGGNAFEIDIDNATIINTVKIPTISDDFCPHDVAINNAGKMFVPQGGGIAEVSVNDMSFIRTNSISPTNTPHFWNFILSSDDTKLYSITYGNDGHANIFLVINVDNFNVEASVDLKVGNVEDFAFRPFELPDGSKLYALGGEQNEAIVIRVIETNNYTIQKTITFNESGLQGISAGPYYPFAYDSDSHTLFVGTTHAVLAIDTNTDVIKKVIYLGDAARAIGLEPWQLTYINAIGLVYNPHENYLYIAHLDYYFLSIYDLNNDQFLPQIIPMKGFHPISLFANDDYSKIYCINTRSDNISVIDVNSKTEEKVIDLHDYLSTSIHEKIEIPSEFNLNQNYPNPFNPETTIKFQLPKVSEVTISIYNILGQKIKTLVDEEKQYGYYTVKWDGTNDSGMKVSSGIYLYQIKAGDFVRAKKMVFLK